MQRLGKDVGRPLSMSCMALILFLSFYVMNVNVAAAQSSSLKSDVDSEQAPRSVNYPDAPNACGPLVQEAEDGTLFGDFTVANDVTASGIKFVHVPEGSGNEGSPNNAHRVDYCFTIPEDGNYRLKGNVYALHDGSDSLFVKVAGDSTDYKWFIRQNTTYAVDELSTLAPLSLQAGDEVNISVFLREDGARIDKLELENIDGTPTSCGGLFQEAEDGALSGDFEIGNDSSASSGQYVHVPDGSGNSGGGITFEQRVEYCFTVPEYGTYRLNAQVLADDDGDNSFFVQVNDKPNNGYTWSFPFTGNYESDFVSDSSSGADPVELVLSAGEHIVSVYLREDGGRLDTLALEQVSPALSSSGIGCVDASQMIEAEDGDLYGSFTTGTDGGTTYVEVPESYGNRILLDRTQKAEYCFDVQTAGTYRIKANVYAPDNLRDSYFVQFDGYPNLLQQAGDPPLGYTWLAKQNTSYDEDFINNGNQPVGGTIDPVEIMLSEGTHTIAFFLRESGTRLDKVGLELVEAASPIPGGACSTALEQEAEDAELHGAFVKASSGNASGGQYIHVPDGFGDRGSPDELQKAVLCYDVQTAGTYQIKGWIGGETSAEDSFWVKVDGQPANGYGWDIPQHMKFQDPPSYVNDGVDTLDPNEPDEPIEVALSEGEHIIEIFLREDGTQLDRLALELVGGNPPTPTPTPTPNGGGGSCGGLIQEAEDGELFGAFTVGEDNGVQYIYVPESNGDEGSFDENSNNKAVFCVDVPEDGEYEIGGSVRGPDNGSDSFFLLVDDEDFKWSIPGESNFVDHFKTTVDLDAGEHTIAVYLREDGAQIDKIKVQLEGADPATPTPTTTPSPTGEPLTPTTTPSPTGEPPTPTPTTSPPGSCNSPVSEAEHGTYVGFQVGTTINASGNQYLHVPDGEGNITSGPDNSYRADYCLQAPTAGLYRIKARVLAANDSNDSFYVQVNGAPSDGHTWDVLQGIPFHSEYVTDNGQPVELTLQTGEQVDVSFFLREDGTQLDVVGLERVDGVPVDLEPCTGLFREAENGLIYGAFETAFDVANASASRYIHVPEGTGNETNGPDTSKMVEYCFDVETAGQYLIRGRTLAPDVAGDSVYFQLDNEPANGYRWSPPVSTNYVSNFAAGDVNDDPFEFNLTPGEHKLRIFLREDGLRFDTIELVQKGGSSGGSCSDGPIIEAEDGEIIGGFAIGDDSDGDPSGGEYIYGLSGLGTSFNVDHRVDYCFNIAEDGTYRVKGDVYAEGPSQDSFYFQSQGSPSGGYIWDFEANDDYDSDYVSVRGGDDPFEITLNAGDEFNFSLFLREAGGRLDKLELELIDGSPPGGPECRTDFVQEAESGALVGDFVPVNDGRASGGQFIHVPSNKSDRGEPDEGQKTEYCFITDEPGTYRLKGWLYATNDGTDSFFVKVAGSPTDGYLWDFDQHIIFDPYQYLTDGGNTSPVEFFLPAGEHTIGIYLREAGARLDKLELEPINTAANVQANSVTRPDVIDETEEPVMREHFYLPMITK